MSPHATPKVSRARTLPLVWIVPLLALAVGGWMIFREFSSRGPEITIDFPDASGVEAGKTVLEHKGVDVGTVKSVDLKPDLRGVTVTLRLDRQAKSLAVTGSKFWIVHPEIGFSGVRGLDTLLTGSRLNVNPGQGAPATHFVGLDKPPPPEEKEAGRAFILQGDKLGSLSTGAPIFYREVKVGAVETSRLAEDSASVLVRIRILKPYVALVRQNTRFWNAGGASFRVNLLGAALKTTSLESLFSGGVAFSTPDNEPLAPVAEDGTQFKLYDEAEKDWLKWSPHIAIQAVESTEEPPPDNPVKTLMKP